MDSQFIFYWTEDNDSGRGLKVYAQTEEQRDEILGHYFEASLCPIDGIRYPRKAKPFAGFLRYWHYLGTPIQMVG